MPGGSGPDRAATNEPRAILCGGFLRLFFRLCGHSLFIVFLEPLPILFCGILLILLSSPRVLLFRGLDGVFGGMVPSGCYGEAPNGDVSVLLRFEP